LAPQPTAATAIPARSQDRSSVSTFSTLTMLVSATADDEWPE
jgi:hypothetical protein